MAQAMMHQLLNISDNDGAEEFDVQHLHRQLDPCRSSEFDIFTCDLSSDFSPSELLHFHGNPSGRAPRTESAFIDSLKEDVPESESVITRADISDRENQVNFVTDLPRRQVEQPQSSMNHFVTDSELSGVGQSLVTNFENIQGSDEIDSAQLEYDLGLGFLAESDSEDVRNSGFVAENLDLRENFNNSLRVLQMGMESDSDLRRNAEIQFTAGVDEENAGAGVSNGDSDDPPLMLLWDLFRIEDHRESNEGDVLNMFSAYNSNNNDGSDMGMGDAIGLMGSLERQAALHRRNLRRTFPEYNNYTPARGNNNRWFAELQFSRMIRPPAAKVIVKNLPLVTVGEDESKNNDLICVVCNDEMRVGQNSRQLPCNHRYHEDCILSWLGSSNTCPICRHELPTDDAKYERMKRYLRPTHVH